LTPNLQRDSVDAPLSKTIESALAIQEDDGRASALCDLLPNVPTTQARDLYDFMLRSCLGLQVTRIVGDTVSRRRIGRAFLLERIGDAAGVLAAIGGERLVAEILHAIEDVTERWP
jgi:hypothetical protein